MHRGKTCVQEDVRLPFSQNYCAIFSINPSVLLSQDFFFKFTWWHTRAKQGLIAHTYSLTLVILFGVGRIRIIKDETSQYRLNSSILSAHVLICVRQAHMHQFGQLNPTWGI